MIENYIKEDAIKDKLIVFDTNIFLNFYYFDECELECIRKFLHDISAYIWEPKHVKLEFEDARERKIREVLNQFKKLEAFYKEEDKHAERFLKQFKRNHMIDVDFLQKDKNDFNYDIQHRYSVKKEYYKKNNWRIGRYKYKKNDVLLETLNEVIFSKIDESMDFNVNEFYDEYKELETYPGKEDLEKNSNKDGDFIIWISMILKSKEVKKDIIFVTGEKKCDWCDDKGNCHDFLLNKFQEETGNEFILLNLNDLIKTVTRIANFKMLSSYIQHRYFYETTIKNISPYKDKYSSLAIQDIVINGKKKELSYLSEDKIREWKLLLMTREFIDYEFENLICGGIEDYRYALALPIFRFKRYESCYLLCKIIAIYVTTNQGYEEKHWEITIEGDDMYYRLPGNNYLKAIDTFFGEILYEKKKNESNNTYKSDILELLFE